MGEAKRYKHMTLFGNQCLCVSADDYDALRAENAELVAALEQIKGSAGTPEQIWGIAKAAIAKHRGE